MTARLDNDYRRFRAAPNEILMQTEELACRKNPDLLSQIVIRGETNFAIEISDLAVFSAN
ncbi:hypothetical protein VC273_01430 [Xanthomonas nasturtii]|uniref:hypothetical protein n=1 Tax=Xanthomonas TaxID=338 RepID=UPI002B22B2B9|nr:hypothetical protein [Xanthomonas nasturtii]MEA9554634.1 hypothetical protein [Xanthomonas nasturtii]